MAADLSVGLTTAFDTPAPFPASSIPRNVPSTKRFHLDKPVDLRIADALG